MTDSRQVDDHIVLQPEPASASLARAFIAEALARIERAGLIDTAQLAVSELVTNAVLHANTEIELAVLCTPDGVRVEVCDGHPGMPAVRDYGGYATTGRGLGLVSALAAEMGVEATNGHGKRVWFTLNNVSDGAEILGWAEWDIDELLLSDEVATDGDARDAIVFQQMPVTLWLAAQQHHDAVLRELILYRAEHPAAEDQVDIAAAQQAESLLASAVDAALHNARGEQARMTTLPPGHPSPLPTVPEGLDVELAADDAVHERFSQLQDVLDEAELLAAAGQLLVRPALPEIIAVRDWCCEQTIAQVNGVPPSAWAGSDLEVFTRGDSGRFQTAPPQWDASIVRDADRCAVAADDNNRLVAVSRPAATMLGWDVDELVGRRVVTLVPPRHREAHVAGFTRHLTTGQSHVLGIELDLPVLHADGHEITCTFLIERVPSAPGRTVYVAWLTPVEESAGAEG